MAAFARDFTCYPAIIRAVGGSQVSVPVTIQNVGGCVWPSVGDPAGYTRSISATIGSLRGQTVIWDDSRQRLPHDLAPYAEIQMVIDVTAPLVGGKYILELDMVQEAVAWFKQKSSIPARVEAEIEPAPSFAAAPADPPPRMEAYGVEKSKVVELLTSSGAKVLDTVPDVSAGPEWSSFLYFATK